jgi:hypothetical protein
MEALTPIQQWLNTKLYIYIYIYIYIYMASSQWNEMDFYNSGFGTKNGWNEQRTIWSSRRKTLLCVRVDFSVSSRNKKSIKWNANGSCSTINNETFKTHKRERERERDHILVEPHRRERMKYDTLRSLIFRFVRPPPGGLTVIPVVVWYGTVFYLKILTKIPHTIGSSYTTVEQVCFLFSLVTR